MPSLSSSRSQASPRGSPSAFSCPGFHTSRQLSGPAARARSGTPSPSVSTAMIGAGVGGGGGAGVAPGGGGVGSGRAGAGVGSVAAGAGVGSDGAGAAACPGGGGLGAEPAPSTDPVPVESPARSVKPVPAPELDPRTEPVRAVEPVPLGDPSLESESAPGELADGGLVGRSPGDGVSIKRVSVRSPAGSSSRPPKAPPPPESADHGPVAASATDSTRTPSGMAHGANPRVSRRRGALEFIASTTSVSLGVVARAAIATGELPSSLARLTSAWRSTACASRAWRRIRSASEFARAPAIPVSRLSARVPTFSAAATLTVRHASSVRTVPSSSLVANAATATDSPRASRSRRSARRAMRKLTPRARRPPIDATHV